MPAPRFANLKKLDVVMYSDIKNHAATEFVKIEAIWTHYYAPQQGGTHADAVARRTTAYHATMRYLDRAIAAL